jgi:hypothetical protein
MQEQYITFLNMRILPSLAFRDKRDSRKLARLLESNMPKRVHVLTEEERMHTELLRTRYQSVFIEVMRRDR